MMATIAAAPAERKASERKFYTRMALFLVLLVLLGFGPSFYLRGIVPSYPRPNPTLPPTVILHGTVFTLWMALIVTQTQLIAARKHHVHMRLGKAGMFLAILMIPVMYLAAVWQVARANQPPFTDPLTWTIVPLATIIPFAILVANGWSHRRDVQFHKRMMLSAAILVVMGPSIGRLPLAPPSVIGFTIQMLLGFLLFVPLIVHDRRSLGHVHAATKLGISMAALWVVCPLSVFWFNLPWAKVAAHLPGVGA
jgi:FtsH-binding integral membrane protein